MYLPRLLAHMTGYTRRTALGALAAAGVAGLAGCLGGAGGSDANGSDSSTATPPPTPVPGGRVAVGPEAFGGHAAADGIEGQPVLGDVSSATGVVVAFEDPSCPRCAAFERAAGARIRSELVPAGDVAFVARTVPIVYPWGRRAVPALEATFARDADAFWSLFDFYFAEQSSFTTDNVLDRTESFLAEGTDLDAAAVLGEVNSGTVANAVDADVAAARAAGVDGTPTVFLFRDGEYRTRATGSVSFDVVTGALGL
jgi:protein-disulfide isomerase